MTFLLDVNVLIALMDPSHVSHDAAHRWFDAEGKPDWATCPITQNGVVRIVSHPKFPNSPGAPGMVIRLLETLCSLPGHHFWPNTIGIAHRLIDPAKVLTSAHVTDVYLLALAVSQSGMLATLDRRLPAQAVENGAAALRIIPP